MALERQYHDTDSVYPLPNDKTEHGRLDNQSKALNLLMFGKPFHALADQAEGVRAIDIGCGTGVMTTLLGEALIGSKVYGVDISKVPEERHQNSGNVEYIQGDINKLVGVDPRLQAGSFSYTFSRLLVSSVTSWPKYLSLLYDLLEPGGYAELQEPAFRYFDKDLPSGPEIEWKWLDHFLRVSLEKNGVDWLSAEHLEEYMKQAGFVDVKVKWYYHPWDEEVWKGHEETQVVGVFANRELLDTKTLMVERILRDKGEFGEEELKGVREEMEGTRGRRYFHRFWVVWGRKPV